MPFYRRLQLPLNELKRLNLPAILGSLPLVTKDMIRVVGTPIFWQSTHYRATGPKPVVQPGNQPKFTMIGLSAVGDKESVAFARSWWGLRFGQRCIFVWGHGASLAPGWPGIKDRILRPLKDFLRRRIRLNAYRMDQESLNQYVRKMVRFQPTMHRLHLQRLFDGPTISV